MTELWAKRPSLTNVSPLDSTQLLQFKEERAEQLGAAAAAVAQALERVKTNMKWVSLNKEQVMDWFSRETEPERIHTAG